MRWIRVKEPRNIAFSAIWRSSKLIIMNILYMSPLKKQKDFVCYKENLIV